MPGRDGVCRVLYYFRVAGYVYHYKNMCVLRGCSKKIVSTYECILVTPGGKYINKSFLCRTASFQGTTELTTFTCKPLQLRGYMWGFYWQFKSRRLDSLWLCYLLSWPSLPKSSWVLPTSLITIRIGPGPALINTTVTTQPAATGL